MANRYITPPYFIFRLIKTLVLSLLAAIVLVLLAQAAHMTFYFGKLVDEYLMQTELVVPILTVLLFPKIWAILARPHQIPPHARP